MMRKQSLLLAIGFIAILGMSFNGCKKDETENITGEALFSYVTDGLKVTFTNQSDISGSVTYAWDFGDEKGTSTEKDPVYTYASKGEYTVTLTVKDEQGTNHPVSTKIAVDKSSPVDLEDNSFEDWANISEAFTPGANAGVVKSFKYDYDSKYIYFYIKVDGGTTDSSQIVDMLIDVNMIDSAGYSYDIWPKFQGAEILIEGSFTNFKDNGDLYWFTYAPWNPDGTEWDDGDTPESIWPIDESVQDAARKDGSYKLTGTVKEMEFAISRENIPELKGVDKIKVVVWTSDSEWEENGWIKDKNPGDNSNPEADGVVITM